MSHFIFYVALALRNTKHTPKPDIVLYVEHMGIYFNKRTLILFFTFTFGARENISMILCSMK